MELSYKEIRAQICDVCHKMWQLGWVASNDGNVSVKLSDGTFLATPTGVSKSMVTPEMIVHINKAGEMIETVDGYRRRPKCGCISDVMKNAKMSGRYYMHILRLQRDLPWQTFRSMSIP